ncbi:MAG TPA: glutathione S-transferase family protein [Caulobacteraceae bacterium]|jgi:glutathione S-transferase|nr:glutathione S-transferase family protein [Caulobacteraceae bacterium]
MLKLWGRKSSLNVQKVLWALAEIGLDYEHVNVGGQYGGLDQPAFLAKNPHGRIPVIEDDGAAIWESNAIVRHLAGRYSLGGLAPSDPIERAQSDQWMDWCATALAPAFIDFFWSWYRTPENQRNEALNRAQLARAHQAFAVLGKSLGDQPFLTGSRLTMGDIPAAALLFRYFTLEIDRPRLPRLEAWYARLCDREAYRRGVMIAYDELKGRLN